IVDDRVVGAIAVGDHEGRSYDSDEVRLAQAFVDQAAMALEKARLFEDSERRRREAEIFADLASQIIASLDLDTILKWVREAARVEGMLAVFNRSPGPFTDRDEARLTRLAAQTSIAIRNAQLLEARHAYQARLEGLLDVSHELSRIQPVEELLGAIAAACGRVLESESVGFRLVEGDELVVAGLWGDAKETMSTRRIKFGESLSGIVAATCAPLRLDDVTEDTRLIPAHRSAVRRLGYRAFLGVPIKVGERVTGVLSIRTRRPAGFSKDDERIATAF